MVDDVAASQKRKGRPHVIPPAPAWRVDAKGRPEGWTVLDDVDGALGLTLWRALRTVWTWVDTPPDRRGGLSQEPTRDVRERLAHACAEAPDLSSALHRFAALARYASRVDHRVIANACESVYRWAEERSLLETAVHFAEAAARVSEEPAFANVAGRICRRATFEDRSAIWFIRAFRLAVRTRSRREALRALLGYGALLKDLGRYDEARMVFERAARRAERTGRRRQAAEAHHDLLSIAAETGTFHDAERHVRLALSLYPLRHVRLPYLVHDYAFVLLRHGFYSLAFGLLEELVRIIERPDERLLLLSSVAWAAAGAMRIDRYFKAEQGVLLLIGVHEEYAPAAFIHLAEGASLLGLWDRASQYATGAVHAARNRRDITLEQEAVALHASIELRQPRPRCESLQLSDRSEILIRRLASRIRQWKAPEPAGAGATTEVAF